MKQIFTLIIFSAIIFSCKKEVSKINPDHYLQNVKSALKDSLDNADYSALDFSKAVLNKVDSAGLYFLRVPFYNKSLSNDFVLVKTGREGKVEKGKIIHLEGKEIRISGSGGTYQNSWEGNISIQSLNRKTSLSSPVHNGFVTAFHSQVAARSEVLQAPDLPEVVVVAYVHNYDFTDISTWLWLNSFFYQDMYGDGGGGGNNASGYYGSIDGGGGYSGGGGSSTGTYDGVPVDNTIDLEPEYVYSIPSIDLNRVFKCFDYVPSSGATFSIKLCADIPSNGNPNASSNSSAVSAGHTFLIVSKTNGATSVTQSFGFYPEAAPSWLDPFAPVTSTMKDNGAQEINASIEMTLSESQFNLVKQNAINWSARKYQLGDYNCTNYAMDVFNSARSEPISISPYKVVLPGGGNPWGPSDPVTITIDKSPQMLFTKLQQMKTSSSEASKIIIDQTHNSHAPISKGECN